MDEKLSEQIARTLNDVKNLQVKANEKQWNIDFEFVMIGLEGHLDAAQKYEGLE